MKRRMIGCIDCRVDEALDNDYLTLNLCGKPLFTYVVEEVLHTLNITRTIIITNSKYVKYLGKNFFKDRVAFSESILCEYPMLFVSGRAPFLKRVTFNDAIENFRGGGTIFLDLEGEM